MLSIEVGEVDSLEGYAVEARTVGSMGYGTYDLEVGIDHGMRLW